MSTPKLTFEQRARAEQVYGRTCEEPEQVAYEWVDMHDRIEAALAIYDNRPAGDQTFVGGEMVKALKGEE